MKNRSAFFFRSLSGYAAALVFGGVMYGALETLFRGYTHPSMLVTGGVCFLGLYVIDGTGRFPLWKKALLGAALITAAELAAGCICNLWLGWGVWDYSGMPLNFRGQICLPFSLLWLALTLPAYTLASWLRRAVGAQPSESSEPSDASSPSSSSSGSPFSS